MRQRKPPKLPVPSKRQNPNPGSLQDLIEFCRRLARKLKGDDRLRFLSIAHHLTERSVQMEYQFAMCFERVSRFKFGNSRIKKSKKDKR